MSIGGIGILTTYLLLSMFMHCFSINGTIDGVNTEHREDTEAARERITFAIMYITDRWC